MKARTIGVNASIPVVVGVEVATLAAILILPPGRWSWWPTAATAVVAILALMLTVYRRTVVKWIVDRVRWRRRRRRTGTPAPSIDIPHGASLYGVRMPERIVGDAITMIEVTGQAYSPTLLTGSATALTPNRLPLDALSGLLDQPGGIKLSGIDVVSSGLRVRRGTGYPPLYSTLLADRPAAGQRRTYLVVRLDVANSVRGLTYRSTVGATAAAATERIINTLLQRGVRAKPLTAKDIDAAMVDLGANLAVVPAGDEPANAPVGPRMPTPVAPTEEWKTIQAHPGYLTSYYFSPEDITTNTLQQMWTLRSDAVVQTISLTKRRGPTQGRAWVSALVRVNDPQAPTQPPTLYLNPLPGHQGPAALRSAPLPRSFDAMPARPLDASQLDIPVGSSGVLIGTTQRGDLLLLSLTDPDQATRIALHTGMPYACQLLVRAAAVGERIAIYTDKPARWRQLEQPLIAVVDHRHPPEFVPSIVVSDRAGGPPPAGLASTVIAIGDAESNAATPDLSFTQISASTVRIATSAFTTDVQIATFKAEQPFLGSVGQTA
ncbi:type VII secretion protein EccE [Mycobacterium sp. ITM-2016-00318]|uniref:type VII secretion protein EccE n=1 Tax=Mycobacterium sp. ITM-2016-00318 TaxID=2099693 RepID=UPI00287F70DD|nr:type VII secretion protein EccE [Mycobacterium sp. ITM-2016-00318]WNG92979.1 type VII secretion protein EccE [Mycobacterium sp. ITM-2016-00318]